MERDSACFVELIIVLARYPSTQAMPPDATQKENLVDARDGGNPGQQFRKKRRQAAFV